MLKCVHWSNLTQQSLALIKKQDYYTNSDPAAREEFDKETLKWFDDQGVPLVNNNPDPNEKDLKKEDQKVVMDVKMTEQPSTSSTPVVGLLIVGGLSLGEAERGDISQPNVMCYSMRDKRWTPKCPWPERGLRGFSVNTCESGLIVAGKRLHHQENFQKIVAA